MPALIKVVSKATYVAEREKSIELDDSSSIGPTEALISQNASRDWVKYKTTETPFHKSYAIYWSLFYIYMYIYNIPICTESLESWQFNKAYP
jgi:hypothetical protein